LCGALRESITSVSRGPKKKFRSKGRNSKREGAPFAVCHLRWQKNPKEGKTSQGGGLRPRAIGEENPEGEKAMRDALSRKG